MVVCAATASTTLAVEPCAVAATIGISRSILLEQLECRETLAGADIEDHQFRTRRPVAAQCVFGVFNEDGLTSFFRSKRGTERRAYVPVAGDDHHLECRLLGLGSSSAGITDEHPDMLLQGANKLLCCFAHICRHRFFGLAWTGPAGRWRSSVVGTTGSTRGRGRSQPPRNTKSRRLLTRRGAPHKEHPESGAIPRVRIHRRSRAGSTNGRRHQGRHSEGAALEEDLGILADRQVLGAVVGNLLQKEDSPWCQSVQSAWAPQIILAS